ncbi:MAG: tetratricopeptide repeat protein [Pseudomonadota bacterium]
MSLIGNTVSHMGKCAVLLCLDPTVGGLAASATAVTFASTTWDIGKDVLLSSDQKKHLEEFQKKLKSGLETARKGFSGTDNHWEKGLTQSRLAMNAFAPGERMMRELVRSGTGEQMLQIAEDRKSVIDFENPNEKAACETALEVLLQTCRSDASTVRELQTAYLADINSTLEKLAAAGGDLASILKQYENARLLEMLRSNTDNLDLSFCPPTQLLKAQHEVVPLFGRVDELDDITEWCSNDLKVGLRTYFGEAGTGKTRLMIEAIRRQSILSHVDAGEPWACGFLSYSKSKFDIPSFKEFFRAAERFLIVIDYADAETDFINNLFEAWNEVKPEKLRIILLSRKDGSWRDQQLTGQAAQINKGPAGETFDLRPLVLDHNDRGEYFASCTQSFASELSMSGSETSEESDGSISPTPDLSTDEFENALLVAMMAYTVLHGQNPQGVTELFDEVIKREEGFWQKRITQSGLGEGDLVPVRTAIVLITLLQGHEDRASLKQTVLFALEINDRDSTNADKLCDLLTVLYPPIDARKNGCSAMEPDRIGEFLVRKTLHENSEILSHLLDKISHNMRERVFGFFERVRQTGKLTEWLSALSLFGHLPQQTVKFAELAAEVIGLINILVSASQENSDELSEEEKSLKAAALNSLANRLSALGRREEALSAGEEAVSIQRDLADTRPDAFLPNLASSLNNLANRLSALGRREEALSAGEEAVSILRDAADTRPDAFLPDLASSLNKLANRPSALGRREEALSVSEEAVSIHRDLADTRPDGFLPNLATSLNNLANRLSALGHREEALLAGEEAVSIRRGLADARPDAFLPDLASSLNNLAAHLSALGRREEALSAGEEAVSIHRDLADTRPDAFLPNLATNLNNIAAQLSALGRREDALLAGEEAVSIRRDLAEAHPDVFHPDLASSLNNLAAHLSALGRHEEALSASEKAISIHRDLADARPDAFLPDLASSLNNLANRLSALGRLEEALLAGEEAVSIRRDLAEARPDAFFPDLAKSLGAHGRVFESLEQYETAASNFAEAVGIMLPYLESLPQAHAKLVTALMRDYLSCSEKAEVAPDMELTKKVLVILAEAGLIELPESNEE